MRPISPVEGIPHDEEPDSKDWKGKILIKILKYQSETLIADTPFFGQKKKSPILYLKIVISWVVYPEGFSRVPNPNHKFWIQIHNTIFV